MKITYVNDVPAVKKDEAEIRLIKLPAGFGCEELWYGETPVTEGQWQSMMGGELDKGENYPKVKVSFTDVEKFCEKLSVSSGVDFRLPTEIEQCRALGEEPTELKDYVVFGQDIITEVKTKLPNEYGLFDVRGLIWEWSETETELKSLRGGSWNYALSAARAVFRSYYLPADRGDHLGFRVVCCRPAF